MKAHLENKPNYVGDKKPIPDWVQEFADALNKNVVSKHGKESRKEALAKELAKKQK